MKYLTIFFHSNFNFSFVTKEKILRVHYVWVLCRDQNELDPKAAWRLLDLSANSAEQWL